MTATASIVSERPHLLFVDDEQPVLDAIAANLRRSFEVATATSGAAGLDALRRDPQIAVVVSDMRMPAMTGAVFLTHAREVAPHAVRMLLTGHSDLQSAITAVNQGQLFRFLTKPCQRDELRSAIDSAVEQYRLQHAERELLEQTLRGSIKMLVDILALTSPAAFGRANRIKTRVLELAHALGFVETWQLEVAALASQLGYITLPHELCDKLEHHEPLTDDDRRVLARAPETTAALLGNIPRLEVVREILTHHVRPPRPRNTMAMGRLRLVELGAHVLRTALDLDELGKADDPVGELRARGSYDAEVLEALERIESERRARQQIIDVAPADLRVGMVVAEDVRLATGTLLVARGYEVTRSFIERVRNFPSGAIRGAIRIVT
jgi:FixJ family two-component response regulator